MLIDKRRYFGPDMCALVRRAPDIAVFNAGEWRAKLGDGQQFRGTYSAPLVREGDGVKIFEETVNVAVP